MMGLEAPEHCKGYFGPILTHSSPKKLETLTFSIGENQNILVKFSLSQHIRDGALEQGGVTSLE